MGECRIRHGIKLYERRCKICKEGTYWVPRSSKQTYCSNACLTFGGEKKWSPTYIRKVRKVNYDLKKDDYE